MENTRTFAVVVSGVVVNNVLWDGTTDWHHDGTAVETTSLAVKPDEGWTYDGSTFTNPNPPAPIDDSAPTE